MNNQGSTTRNGVCWLNRNLIRVVCNPQDCQTVAGGSFGGTGGNDHRKGCESVVASWRDASDFAHARIYSTASLSRRVFWHLSEVHHPFELFPEVAPPKPRATLRLRSANPSGCFASHTPNCRTREKAPELANHFTAGESGRSPQAEGDLSSARRGFFELALLLVAVVGY